MKTQSQASKWLEAFCLFVVFAGVIALLLAPILALFWFLPWYISVPVLTFIFAVTYLDVSCGTQHEHTP